MSTRKPRRGPDIDPSPTAPASAAPDPVEDDPLDMGDNPEGERVVDPVKDAKSQANTELNELLGMDNEQKKNDRRFVEIHRKGVVSYQLKPEHDPS